MIWTYYPYLPPLNIVTQNISTIMLRSHRPLRMCICRQYSPCRLSLTWTTSSCAAKNFLDTCKSPSFQEMFCIRQIKACKEKQAMSSLFWYQICRNQIRNYTVIIIGIQTQVRYLKNCKGKTQNYTQQVIVTEICILLNSNICNFSFVYNLCSND